MNLNREHCWPIAFIGHLRWVFTHVFVPVWQARLRYSNVLRRLQDRRGEEPYKVLFVTGTPSKWKCQSLYDLMERSDRYDPWICQTICDVEKSMNHAERTTHLEKSKSFFKNRGMKYVEAYSRDREEWIDLNDFHADIVFYNQPWSVSDNQLPHCVAKTALTFQVPYYVPNYGDVDFDVKTPFQRTLFGYCAINKSWAEFYQKNVSYGLFAGRILPVGHTALDPFYLNRGKYSVKGTVIYAPHWSIDCPGNENTENYSTFLTTGRAMLKFAKAHPEIKWVFRPHPTLRTVLARTGIWSVDEIESYYADWAAIGLLSVGGGYEQLLMESAVMITDCGSFLMEYACTGNPIVHLISSTCKVKPIKPSADLWATYYQVRTLEELDAVLNEVVVRRQDPKREERLAKVRESGLLDTYAARNILNVLDQLLGFGK